MARGKLYPMMVANEGEIFVVYGDATTGVVLTSSPGQGDYENSGLLEKLAEVVCSGPLEWDGYWSPVAESTDVLARTYNEV